MLETEIIDLKRIGAIGQLSESLHSKLFRIKKATDDAVKDGFKDFDNQDKLIRANLDDAAELLAEIRRLRAKD